MDLLLGLELELLLWGPRRHLLIIIVVRVVDLVAIVGILDVVWERRQRVQVILALSQQACRQEQQEEGGSSHGYTVRRAGLVSGDSLQEALPAPEAGLGSGRRKPDVAAPPHSSNREGAGRDAST